MKNYATFWQKWGGNMYRLFFIAKNNLKKKKSDVAVLTFLTMLAVTLLYVSIAAMTNTGKVLDRVYEETNGADQVFITASREKENLTELISSQEEVAKWEVNSCLLVSGAKYHGVGEEENEGSFCIGVMEEERSIQSYSIQEEGEKKKNSILLPYYFKAGYSYETGDKIYLMLGEHEYEFEVLGFIEDGLFATPLNISVYRCYIGQDYIEEIKEKEKGILQDGYYEYKTKLKQGESSYKFDQKLSELITKNITDIAEYGNLGLNWEVMKGGDAIMSNIGMGIIMIFGALLIIIAIIIIHFSVRNFIQNNMKNIGILQAVGYTSKELKCAGVLEMLCITLLGTILGLVAGYLGGDVVGSLQAMLIGVSWQVAFDVGAAMVTGLLVNGVILFVTIFTVRIYGKITVLNALRGGVDTHNFRKNYVSLEKTKISLQGALGIKNILKEKMKSFTVCLIVVILSFASCVGFVLYQNFSLNPDNLMKLVGIEAGNIGVEGEDLDRIGEELLSWKEVEKIGYYSNSSIKLTKGEESTTLTADFWKNPEDLDNEILVEGRLPEFENEIVITTRVSEMLDAQVGDVIYVEGTGEKKDYIVTGIDQKINNMGIKALLNFEGAERLNGACETYYLYVYTREDITYSKMASLLKDEYKDVKVTDSEKVIDSAISSVAMAMKLICVLFVTITLFVVCMVVMLLVKTKVTQEKRNYGIYKALGFTTKQLIVQMVCTNLPIMIAGDVIGAIGSVYLTELLVVGCLSIFGIKVCDLAINPMWQVVTIVGITVVALVVTVCFSVKIRKIEPAKMLMSE